MTKNVFEIFLFNFKMRQNPSQALKNDNIYLSIATEELLRCYQCIHKSLTIRLVNNQTRHNVVQDIIMLKEIWAYRMSEKGTFLQTLL